MMDDFEDAVIDKIVGRRRTGRRCAGRSPTTCLRWCGCSTATTAMTLSHDSAFVGRGAAIPEARSVEQSLERLWVGGNVWRVASPGRDRVRSVRSPPWREAERLCGQALLPDRGRQRDRPRDRAEAGRRGRRAVPHRPRRRGSGADGRRRPRAGRRRCPSTAPSTSPTTTQVAAFAADIHSAMSDPSNGRGDEHRRGLGVGHRRPAHPPALEVDGRHQPDGTRSTSSRRSFPPMVAAGRGGHLVNVSSAAGLVALPWHAAYSASKYGLRGLSEVLRFDLARHRIGVSVVVPGAVKTPLVQTVQIAGVDRDDPQGAASGPTGSAATRSRRKTSAEQDPGRRCAATAS